MDSDQSNLSSPPTKPKSSPTNHNRDFLLHLESYLSKRDGVDKLLEDLPLRHQDHPLRRKAFRLGKFIQDVNSLRSAKINSKQDVILSIAAYGGEGLYYFVEQFVWLAKSGVIDSKHSRILQRISVWAELIGYIGSISLKIGDLKGLLKDEACVLSSIEVGVTRGDCVEIEEVKLKKLREKMMMKKLSLVQDVADGLMAVADIRDGKGRLSEPLLLGCGSGGDGDIL